MFIESKDEIRNAITCCSYNFDGGDLSGNVEEIKDAEKTKITEKIDEEAKAVRNECLHAIYRGPRTGTGATYKDSRANTKRACLLVAIEDAKDAKEKGASKGPEDHRKTIEEAADICIIDFCFGNGSSDDTIDIVKHEYSKYSFNDSGNFSHETSSPLEVKRKELRADVTTICNVHLLLKTLDYKIDTTYEQKIIIEDHGFKIIEVSYVKYTDGKAIGIMKFKFDEVFHSCRFIFANSIVTRKTCRSTVSDKVLKTTETSFYDSYRSTENTSIVEHDIEQH